MLENREQWKLVLKGKKLFLRFPARLRPIAICGAADPRSAVSHLYFSSGAAVPAQTTYFENQRQLRQDLTTRVQGGDANCLLPREP